MGGELVKEHEMDYKQLNTSSKQSKKNINNKVISSKSSSKNALFVETTSNTPISERVDTVQPKQKRKQHDKIAIVAKNKKSSHEKKALELIQHNNEEKRDYELISSIISKHFFMQTLNKQAKNEIITTMSLCKVNAGVTLFKQGSFGTYWYIVNDGTFQLLIDGEVKKELKRGDSFGEFALMNDAPRSATVIALTDCFVWVLRREAFRKILDFLFQIHFDENIKFLNSIHLPLESQFKSVLANNLVRQIHKAGEVILREGEMGSSMFIIKKGEVNCVKNGVIVRVLHKGDSFGQKVILLGGKRTMDVVAKTDCELLNISIDFFRTQIGENYKQVLYFGFIDMSFKQSKHFSKVAPMLSKVSHLFKTSNYEQGDIVFQKGTNLSNKLCVVLEGSLYDKTRNQIKAKRNEILFEKEISNNETIILQNNLIAEPDCLLAVIDYSKMKNELGGDLKSIKTISEQKASIENINLFKNLSENKKEFLQQHLQTETFNNGHKIINQGETGDKFYIIKSGRVDFFVNSKYVRSLNENEEFGARSLIIAEKRSATAIANGTVEVYTLTSNVFKSILEPNLLDYFKRRFYLEDNTIELKDLDNIRELGKGNFGVVSLVRSRKNKQLYAIKALSLKQIKKEKLEPCVELEKNVLLKVDHPFIMKMVKYLKNEHYIFFIMEYSRGKELWEVIREIGLLNKAQTQFYGGSLILAIEYLHKKKIIYRDIKPENIMVNHRGFIKIIDFGTVKEIKERTSTIIGTPHYMAPEIIKGEGYSFEIDVWSIAICIFEFFCGRLPFGEECDDPMDVYRAVSKETLVFPSFVKDDTFIALMSKMLKKNPLNRLWKFSQIKRDAYFNGFDFDKLISLAIEPPYKLKLKSDDNSVGNGMYLNYLKGITRDTQQQTIHKKSMRSVEFDKWVKNF